LIRSIRFHPSAVQDAEAAVEWYAERSGRAAALFIAELEVVIGRIAAHPSEFP
jgi:plasmid stabilization system protein ParE